MPTPLRGTQTLVGQMGWVFERPLLTAIEISWRWCFGLPFVIVIFFEAIKILIAVPPESSGLATLDPQNPWVAVVQLGNSWALYQPPVASVLRWLLPLAALAWVVVSGLGRSVLLKRLDPALRFRPLAMIALQAAALAYFALFCRLWFLAMRWAAVTHIGGGAEPDLVGFAAWAIFLSLSFFTAWALTSWALSVAPIVMLLEKISPLAALVRSLRLGRPMTAKLVEINMVMGIVNLALIVLAMVLSAAPLPFSDQLGPEALHLVWSVAFLFYFIAGDYFQVVRLKGFLEFWRLFCIPDTQ
jgi:hypothetical protein